MPECKEGQEINPITNRCRKIVCDGTKVYNVKKKKCTQKKCGKGKTLNKRTNRCVKKTIKCKPGEVLDTKKNTCFVRTCEKGKVINPKTLRCIKEKQKVTQKIKRIQKNKIEKIKLEDKRPQMRPPKRALLKDILETYKKMKSTKVIPYGCFSFVEHMMLLHVLKNNKNDCSYDIKSFGNLQAGYKAMNYKKSFMKHIREHYIRCKNNNKMLVVPLTVLSGSHSNILIFNPFRNEVERFEPHGPETLNKRFDNAKINTRIKEFIKEIDATLDYISPSLLCPRLQMGFQFYESSAEDEKGTYNNVAIQDPGGYCCAWSYFYADMRIKFPYLSGKKLIKESQDILGKDPNQLRQFIRGQYTFLVKEMNAINKKYKFEDIIYKRQTDKLTHEEYIEYKKAWNDAIYEKFEKFHSYK
jgi:hypothetical protein